MEGRIEVQNSKCGPKNCIMNSWPLQKHYRENVCESYKNV